MLPVVIAIALAAVLAWRHFSTPAGVDFELGAAWLLEAKQQANASLPDFWAAFDAAAANDSDFMLKFDLNHGRGLPDRESIWAGEISRADGVIRGRLANPPRPPISPWATP